MNSDHILSATDGANDVIAGLNDEQVRQRHALGQVNSVRQAPSKTYTRILSDNIFTLFNAINIVLATLIFSVGAYMQALFMGVVISNILIGIVQEIRAKRTIEKLSLIVAPYVSVVRDAQTRRIGVDKIVLDDVIELKAGSQIPSDAKIIATESLEVDESLLTGESHPVRKRAGDEVLSGSFVSAGSAYARVLRVGKDNYAMKLSSEARRTKRIRSKLVVALNRIIKILSFVIIPVGLLLFLSQILGEDFLGQLIEEDIFRQIFGEGLQSRKILSNAIVGTVAGIIGMIPEGLILLSTIAFAVGVVKLGKHKTLVQALPCIETLARVDVLCLDKTGTITDGTMEVEDVIVWPAGNKRQINAELNAAEETDARKASLADQALRSLVAVSTDTNATQMALKRRFGTGAPSDPQWNVRHIVPFSSRRRWSGTCFNESGWVLGSPEDLCPHVRNDVSRHAAMGLRVLALVRVWGWEDIQENETLPDEDQRELYALILLADTVRPQAPETLRFFADQGVEIKVISGDNPLTVAATAQKAGLSRADKSIDVSTLTENDDWRAIAENYTVFGRVDPYSKKKLIQSLRGNGHIVGMTGDGVNDVLALKEADCSIAMASGSDAARAVSELVLMESNFAAMPAIVHEGRRVVNNIERVAVLYLLKTVYSALLCVTFILLKEPYPLFPIHLTLIGMTSIGVPSFFLALAANKNRVEGDFLKKTLTKAAPCGLLAVLNALAIQFSGMFMSWDAIMTRTLTALMIGAIGLMVLSNVCHPLKGKRLLLVICMTALFAVGFSGLGMAGNLNLPWWDITPPVLICLLFAAGLDWFLVRLIFQRSKSSRRWITF